MSQQVKITRRLDLNRTAERMGYPSAIKTANYTVVAAHPTTPGDSGKFFLKNVTGTMFFTLPPVNVGGQFWSFAAINTGNMQIVGDTNAILHDLSVNTAHGLKAVNCTGGIGQRVDVFSDGTRYIATSHVMGNAAEILEG